MLYCIEHETRLTYTEPVTESVIELRMAPTSSEDQTVLAYRLRTAPAAPVTCYRDGFGNRTELFNLIPPHREVVVRATSYVRVHRRPGHERLLAAGDKPAPAEALEFLLPSPLVGDGPEVVAFLAELPPLRGPLAGRVEALVEAVRGRLKYEKKVTDARTPVGEALALGRGVCQDFAHLFLAAARGRGVPARYVSGYVHQPGEVETHAWCQVWGGPAVGWVDVDPTHGDWAGDGHVVTAVGRDFSDVPPNRGVWRGAADEAIAVSVSVRPVERVPPELLDAGGPTWNSPAPARNGRPQQQRPAGLFRQQQSQQQQAAGRHSKA
jgi:transglutaminase-like putative cysteine protease